MYRALTHRRRLPLLLGVIAVLLTTMALQAFPANAQVPDPDTIHPSVESRMTHDVTTYSQPDPASPVFGIVRQNEVVEMVARTVGKDGQIWLQVTHVDATPAGWMRLVDFQSGVSTIGEDFFGFFPGVFPGIFPGFFPIFP
jgi:hypothetical protein